MPGNAWSSVGHFEIRGRPDLIHFELAGAEGPAVICKFARLSLAGAESPAFRRHCCVYICANAAETGG